jgi:hypothetical protein
MRDDPGLDQKREAFFSVPIRRPHEILAASSSDGRACGS